MTAVRAALPSMSERSGSTESSRPRDLRVAIFSGNYNCTRDGANMALNRLVSHLLDRDAAVRVYSPTSAKPAFEHAGDLISVPSLPIPGRSEYRIALGLPPRIREDIRDFRPNVVHLSAPDWLGSAAQSFAQQLGLPVIGSMHTRFETYFEHYGLGCLKSWALHRQQHFYARCDGVLAPNSFCGKHLERLGVTADRISLWGRGVDRQTFTPQARDPNWRRALGYADDQQVVLFLGRIVREKGLREFVGTVGELRKRGHSIVPLIVGDGPAVGELRRAIGEANFLGHLEGRELGRAIASSDILLNPSITEAFGNVNLEAMACGLIVVSADVGSATSLLQHGVTGLLSKPCVSSLANTIEPLLREPMRFSTIRARAVMSAREHEWHTVCDAVIDAYQGILSRLAESGPVPRTSRQWLEWKKVTPSTLRQQY